VKLFYRNYMGYFNFRIPSLCVALDKTIIAIAEGRVHTRWDVGDINLVMRRSFDGGQTWTDGEMIWDYGAQSVSNPTMVLDRDTGRIFLFVVLNSYEEEASGDPSFAADDGDYYRYSDDSGATWSEPISVRHIVGENNWPGPGHGIQLCNHPYEGRLVIPLRRRSIYSDDHGQTWQLGEPNNSWSETTVVELMDGTLMRNDRSSRMDGLRRISTSKDGGQTWTEYFEHTDLYEPNTNGCEADQITFEHIDAFGNRNQYLIYAGPRHHTIRRVMAIMLSTDQGESYRIGRLLDYNRANYASLAQYDNDTLLLLYEYGHAGEDDASLDFYSMPISTVLEE